LRCAASRIERLVDKRDYSATELDDKLLHDGYSASVRDEAIGRAIGAGLVDDRRFGAAYVRTKLSSGWGVARIERELKRRGVCLEELPGWPQDFLDDETEDERAYRIASTRRLSQKNPFEKLVRFLCGRGFSMGCAMRVARRVVDEQAAAEQ
jgi:regulatory protein